MEEEEFDFSDIVDQEFDFSDVVEQPEQQPTQQEEGPGFFGSIPTVVSRLNRGLMQAIHEPLKFVGELGNELVAAPARAFGAPESVGETIRQFNPLYQAGEGIQQFTESMNPVDPRVNETVQNVAQGLGQGIAMFATAGSSSAPQLAPKVGVAAQTLKNLLSKPAIIGGSITAVPEWEQAKAAGLSDEEAFDTLIKNYLVGQTEAIPIARLLGKLNKITGNKLIAVLKASGVQGLEEGVQEAVQTYLSNVVAKEEFDPERDPLFQVLESAKVGGIVGLLLPSVGVAISNLPESQRAKVAPKIAAMMAEQEAQATRTSDPQIDATLEATATLSPQEEAVLNKQSQEISKELKDKEDAEKDKEGVSGKKPQREEPVKAEPKQEASPETPEAGGILQTQEVSPEEEQVRSQVRALVASGDLSYDGTNIKVETEKGATEFTRLSRELQQIKDNERIAALEKPRPKVFEGEKETTTVNTAIKRVVQHYVKGLERGVKKGAELKDELVAKVQEAAKEHKLSAAQMGTILTKIRRTNLFTPGSISKLNLFIDQVSQDADFAEKVQQGVKLQRQIKSKSKSQTLSFREKQALSEFVKIDPTDIDIDNYLGIAEQIRRGFLPVSNTGYIPLNLSDIQSYIPRAVEERYKREIPSGAATTEAEQRDELSAKEERDRIFKLEKQLGEDFGEFAEFFSGDFDLHESTIAAEKKEKIKAAMLELSSERQAELPTSADTDKKQQILDDMRSADLKELSPEQQRFFTRIADRVITNNDYGLAGRFAQVLNANRDLKALQESGIGKKILNLNAIEEGFTASLPAAFQAITGVAQDAATFQQKLGIKDIGSSFVKAEEVAADFVYKMAKDLRSKLSKQHGKSQNGFTNESILRQATYQELIRQPQNTSPEESFSQNKAVLEQNIVNWRAAGETSKADLLQKLYAPFSQTTSVEEASLVMSKIDPAGKKVLDFIIETYKPYGDAVAEYNELYHNRPTEKVDNYAGARKWLKFINGKVVDEPGAISDERINYSTLPNPKQFSSAREFKNIVRNDAVLDFNLHEKAARQLQQIVFQSEAIPHMLKLREMIRNQEAIEKLLGYGSTDKSRKKAKKLYGQLFGENGLYFEFENSLMGRTKPMETYEKMVNEAVNTARTMGYVMSLSGPSQFLKQSTVLANTAIQLGNPKNIKFLFSSIGDLVSKKQQIDEFLQGETVRLRGAQKSVFNLGDVYETKIGKESSTKLEKIVNEIIPETSQKISEGWTGLKPLLKADINSAKASWLAFYRESLEDQGIRFNSWKEETALRESPERQKARAYAKQKVDVLQVVSNPHELPRFLKNKGIPQQALKAFLMPFGTFSSNTKQRLWADYRSLVLGNAEQRGEALKDIAATAAEQTIYQGVLWTLRYMVFAGLQAGARSIFNLPDKEDKKKEMYKGIRNATINLVLDNLPFLLLAFDPVKKHAAEGGNRLAYNIEAQDKGEDYTYEKYTREYGSPNYTPKNSAEQILSNTGVYGIPVERMIEFYETAAKISGGKLDENQKDFAKMVAVLQVAEMFGVFPTDILNSLRREFRIQSKKGGQKTTSPQARPKQLQPVRPQPLKRLQPVR